MVLSIVHGTHRLISNTVPKLENLTSNLGNQPSIHTLYTLICQWFWEQLNSNHYEQGVGAGKHASICIPEDTAPSRYQIWLPRNSPGSYYSEMQISDTSLELLSTVLSPAC